MLCHLITRFRIWDATCAAVIQKSINPVEWFCTLMRTSFHLHNTLLYYPLTGWAIEAELKAAAQQRPNLQACPARQGTVTTVWSKPWALSKPIGAVLHSSSSHEMERAPIRQIHSNSFASIYNIIPLNPIQFLHRSSICWSNTRPAVRTTRTPQSSSWPPVAYVAHGHSRLALDQTAQVRPFRGVSLS